MLWIQVAASCQHRNGGTRGAAAHRLAPLRQSPAKSVGPCEIELRLSTKNSTRGQDDIRPSPRQAQGKIVGLTQRGPLADQNIVEPTLRRGPNGRHMKHPSRLRQRGLIEISNTRLDGDPRQ